MIWCIDIYIWTCLRICRFNINFIISFIMNHRKHCCINMFTPTSLIILQTHEWSICTIIKTWNLIKVTYRCISKVIKNSNIVSCIYSISFSILSCSWNYTFNSCSRKSFFITCFITIIIFSSHKIWTITLIPYFCC